MSRWNALRRDVRFRSRIAIVLATLSLLAAACGLPNDSAPRFIATEDLPSDLTGTAGPTAVPAPDAFSFQIWMVGADDKLTRVGRVITPSPEGVMNSLLAGTEPVEREDDIGTEITRDTDYVNIERFPEFQRLTVNLVDGSLRGSSTASQKLGFAQIVFSLTELLEYEAVAFTIGGEPVAVPIDGGVSEVGQFLRKDDFASLQRNRPGFANPDEFDDAASPAPAPTPRPETLPLDDTTELVDLSVWMIAPPNDNLVRVPRTIGRSPEAILAALFKGPSVPEGETEIRSAISVDAIPPIPDIDESEGIAFVDLTRDDLPPVTSDDRMRAVAQIVFSLTELAEINGVKLSIDGDRIPLPTDDGLSEADPTLTRNDFATLAPNVVGVGEPTPDPELTPAATPDPAATAGPAADDPAAADAAGDGADAAADDATEDSAPDEDAESGAAAAPTPEPTPPPQPTPTPTQVP